MEKSRKKIVFALVAAAIVLSGIITCILLCPQTKIDINKFSEYMLSSSIYYSGMEELDISDIGEHYGGVSGSDVSHAKAFVSADGTAREFAIFEANGTQSADGIQRAISAYCNANMEKYKAGNLEEYERVKGYVIRRTRNYVILTISDGAGGGNQLVDSYFDKINYDRSK